VLHHFQATENIALGIGNGLTLLGAKDHGDTLGMFADQGLQLEHDAHARAIGITDCPYERLRLPKASTGE